MIEAVVFDLDGLLIETEEIWDEVREEIVRERGARWTETAQRDMMGMSSTEWSRYMHEALGVPDAPERINELVVERMAERYRSSLPLLPGAVEAVQRIAARWPLGLAFSSNRPLIELVLDVAGLAPHFQAVVSSEEVARGKPAPDVYLEAAARLGVDPSRAAAVEDSEAGIRSATAAGMRVVAIPNRTFPPSEEAVELADVVLASLDELTPGVIES
jgi:HAD superfamily hydrolase (TIGR01509 family)